jgi:hypothetical protein
MSALANFDARILDALRFMNSEHDVGVRARS